ncbi:MAG: hypothetical protein ISS81_00910 [Candidatus Marinimicrobia bacterium]|nr:hypothetical protein [Candidatus Neomarinimicrobiota bacterium]
MDNITLFIAYIFIPIIAIAIPIYIYKRKFRPAKLKLEYIDAYEKSWKKTFYSVKELNKAINKVQQYYKSNVLNQDLNNSTIPYLQNSIENFANKKEQLDRMKYGRFYYDYIIKNKLQTLYNKYENVFEKKYLSFIWRWFDISNSRLYWKSNEILKRAIIESKRLKFYEFEPIECNMKFKPKEFIEFDIPFCTPAILDFRFRNIGMKTAHITSVEAETVAIQQIGAGSGYYLNATTEAPYQITLSRTKDISKINLSDIGDPDDIIRILV